MNNFPEELHKLIHSTGACMKDLRTLAVALHPLPIEQINLALQGVVDEGEERATSRLLQACAFNAVKLDPEVLCRSIGVCEDILDSAPCFSQQDEGAVKPLLAAAVSEELSAERRRYAGRLAAELTAKHALDPQPVRRVLWKLEHAALLPESQLLIAEALLLLDEGTPPDIGPIPLWSEIKISDLLPEHSPRHVVGGNYTVRRPVAKIGRNDPCHCGSGKKYKKCCYAKDQELLRDASPYAGTTRTELMAQPGLVDDPDVIRQMRRHELKRVAPETLSKKQLLTGYQHAMGFGLRELAFEMLVECEKRSQKDEFDEGHFDDLIENVLDAGDLDLARKIKGHCGDHNWWRPHAIEFLFDLLENPNRFKSLEEDCRKALCQTTDEEPVWDEPLNRIAYGFAHHHPALAIIFARAAIASNPDHYLDNEMLLEVIQDARVDLDLEPGGDQAEALFDWNEDRNQLKQQVQAESKEIERLAGDLKTTLAALDDKKLALRAMEKELSVAGADLESARRPSADEQIATEVPTSFDTDQKATLQRLRTQVDGMKAEIGEQQTERRRLRQLLAGERRKLTALAEPETLAEKPAPAEEAAAIEPTGKLILPEYSDSFRKHCASLPSPLIAKAIQAAGRFAAHDTSIWRQTKPLERLPEHYRIRIGLDYRMILHWQPGKTLLILDLIPRQDLESWIKRHG